MNTPVSIRLANNEDCAVIADIYNNYLGKSTMDLEYKTAAYYIEILKEQGEQEEIWIIEQEKILGWGIIKKYSDRLGYQYTGETSVYLEPDQLGKSYGNQLKRHLLDRCKTLGYHHLLARIFAQNKVSINYNLKLGYRIVGTQKEVGNIHGVWKDVTILEYIIR